MSFVFLYEYFIVFFYILIQKQTNMINDENSSLVDEKINLQRKFEELERESEVYRVENKGSMK